MTTETLLLVGIAVALGALSVGLLVAMGARGRAAEREIRNLRLRHASELRKFRGEVVLERERHRKDEESWKGVSKAREVELARLRAEALEVESGLRREAGDLRARLVRREQESRIFEDERRNARPADCGHGSELARLRAELGSANEERQRFVLAERESRIVVRALEQAAEDLRLKLKGRDEALTSQELILLDLQEDVATRVEELEALRNLLGEREAEIERLAGRLRDAQQEAERLRAESDRSRYETKPGIVFDPEATRPAILLSELDGDAARVEVPESTPEPPPETQPEPEPEPKPEPEPVPVAVVEFPAPTSTLPLSCIRGIGPATEAKLETLGIRDLAALAAADAVEVASIFPKRDRTKVGKWIDEARARLADPSALAETGRGSKGRRGVAPKGGGRMRKRSDPGGASDVDRSSGPSPDSPSRTGRS